MNHRHFPAWAPWLLAVVLSVVLGVAAYRAGVAHGLAVNPSAPLAGMGWWAYGAHPFGFVLPLFFVFVWIVVAKMFFWRAGWHRHGLGPMGSSERLDQWHREAHERMNRPS